MTEGQIICRGKYITNFTYRTATKELEAATPSGANGDFYHSSTRLVPVTDIQYVFIYLARLLK